MTLFEKYLILKRQITESTIHPMIEHNGKMVHRHNSEGQPIHHTDDGIKNFHNWFGDSGAKEEQSSSKQKQIDRRPLVLYHGTHANIHKFNDVNTGTVSHTFGEYTTKRHGIFLTPSKDFAETFAKQGTESGSNVMPLYLHTKNHLDIRDGFDDDDREKLKKHGVDDRTMNSVNKQPHEAWNLFDGNDHFMNAAKKAGYDAIHMTERDSETDKDHHVWVAMHNHQIKSAMGNTGSFSKKSNNITEEQI